MRAADLAGLRVWQPALDKRLAAKTRAWSSTRYFGNGLRQWRQPLSAPSHAHFSGERKKQRLRNLRHTPSASSNIPFYRFASSSVISSQVTPLSAINTIMW